MAEQYYRVKVSWPIPYFCKEHFVDAMDVRSTYDGRFYTTATDLRGVHLAIQEHLAKNYAEKGLNEVEDFDELTLDLPPEEVLRLYGRTNQPAEYQVEVINEPELVNLIDRAIEQRDLTRSISQLIALGLVPTPDGLKKPMFVLGGISADLDRAIACVLRPFYYDDAIELLKDLVEKGDVLIHELQTHAHSVIQQVKGA